MNVSMVNNSLVAALRAAQRLKLTGCTRLTLFLASHLKSLQAVPLHLPDGTLYADLRVLTTHGLLAVGCISSGEDVVMKRMLREGDVALDVGAHIGVYTLLLARLVGDRGNVYAFEPNPEVLMALRRTLSALPNTTLCEYGLSDRKQHAVLVVPEDKSMASLADWTDGLGGLTHKVECDLRRLDDLVDARQLPLPDFIKCDVEGAEPFVFRGGCKTLNRVDAPIIMFEANAQSSRAFGNHERSAVEFLGSLELAKYKFHRILPNGDLVVLSGRLGHANLLAVPESRRQRLQ